MNVLHERERASHFGCVWPGVQCAALHFVVLIALLSLISRSSFWHFGCFSFRLCYSPWCVHIQATDPSITMHRVVLLLLFVLCLVPVSGRLASIGPLTEICNKLKSSHSMRRGAGRGAGFAAGRGKPDGPKRLPISLGFKCAHCRNEFDSRHAMDIHRRHSSLFGTPCADPRPGTTERGDQAPGILREHDTLGVLPIPAFFCSENADFACRNSHNFDIIEY